MIVVHQKPNQIPNFTTDLTLITNEIHNQNENENENENDEMDNEIVNAIDEIINLNSTNDSNENENEKMIKQSNKILKIYNKLIIFFQKRNCELLTTFEEYKTLSTTPSFNVDYIGSCGHRDIVNLRSFKNSVNLHICKNCRKDLKNKKQLDNGKQDILSLVDNINLCREIGLNYIIKYLENDFDVVKSDKGALSTICISPLERLGYNSYLGIKLKFTMSDDILIFNCNYDTTCITIFVSTKLDYVWIFDYVIKNRIFKIDSKKDSPNKVHLNDLSSYLKRYINDHPDTLNSSHALNKPKHRFFLQKYEYIEIRKRYLPYLMFENASNTINDFTLFDRTFQETVTSNYTQTKKNNTLYYNAALFRSEKRNSKSKLVPYEKGMNDFYWINIKNDDKSEKYFYILPETKLIENGFIKDKDEGIVGKTSISLNPFNSSKWYNDFLFDYTNDPLENCRLIKKMMSDFCQIDFDNQSHESDK